MIPFIVTFVVTFLHGLIAAINVDIGETEDVA